MAEYIVTFVDEDFKRHEINIIAKDRLDLIEILKLKRIEDKNIACIERKRKWKKY